MGMEHAIIIDWDDVDHPYPLRMIVRRNRQGIYAYGHRNQAKAGIGIWCGVELQYWHEKAIFPWMPKWLYLIAAFTSKPKRMKCWLKWWKFCYLELKEWAMVRSGQWVYITDNWLWVLRTLDGKLMIFRDEDEIPEEVDKASMTRYHWDDDENAFTKYVPPPPRSMAEELGWLASVATSLMAGC